MNQRLPIYLDYHSTTPVLPEVFEVMRPYFTEHFGNASSRSHAYGWRSAEAVDISRAQVAALLDVPATDIVFTSGATEGLNMLCKGLAHALAEKGRHIVSVATEHPAVLDSLAALVREGFDITLLPVDRYGILDVGTFSAAIRADTIMAVVMWANNETGVLHPMSELAAVCGQASIPLISDATQAVGKVAVHPLAAGVDAIAFSAHKFYGPKGVGALYIHPRLRRHKPEPLIHGGGHESGLRSGTLNVPGIVGMGAAAARMMERMGADMSRIGALRNDLERRIMAACPEVEVNGQASSRLPTVSNLIVRFTESQSVMSRFRTRLAISSGSACSSANPEPSHVLRAMGLTDSQAKASYRFSLGVPTTAAEVDAAAVIFTEAVSHYREESPVWGMFTQGIIGRDDA